MVAPITVGAAREPPVQERFSRVGTTSGDLGRVFLPSAP